MQQLGVAFEEIVGGVVDFGGQLDGVPLLVQRQSQHELALPGRHSDFPDGVELVHQHLVIRLNHPNRREALHRRLLERREVANTLVEVGDQCIQIRNLLQAGRVVPDVRPKLRNLHL
ncbi:hypothetical protein D3C76_1647020 [compost metagenome]